MELIDTVNYLGFIITVTTVFSGLILYFKDPIKRWRFLGYRPTIICAIFDPNTHRILAIDHELGGWTFVQFGVSSNDFVNEIENGIERETGIQGKCLDFRYIHVLGTIKNRREKFEQIYSLDNISISKNTIGKGYIGVLVSCNESSVEKHMEPGIGINDIKFFTRDEMLNVFNENYKIDKKDQKLGFYKLLLKDIEKFIKIRDQKLENVNGKYKGFSSTQKETL